MTAAEAVSTLHQMAAIVSRPSEFKSFFESLVGSLNGLYATTSRGAPGRLCFELAGSRDRPLEFLQCLMDLVRVLYEPEPPGSLDLNSNWDLVSEAVPLDGFRLGYVSVTGLPGQSLQAMVGREFASRLAALGYVDQAPLATFICVSVGAELWRRNVSVVGEANRLFDAGWSVSACADAIKAVAADDGIVDTPATLAGVALDPALAPSQVRVSVWMFLPRARPLALC